LDENTVGTSRSCRPGSCVDSFFRERKHVPPHYRITTHNHVWPQCEIRRPELGAWRFSLAASIAKDLTVADDPNFNAAPFLTAKEVRIGVLLRPLIFSRKVNLQGFQIKSPEINLIRAAIGKWNFSRIARLHASGGGADALLTHNFFEQVPAFGQKTRRPLPHARTSLRAQFHDKSGSVDFAWPRRQTSLYRDVRLPDTTRCPYLCAYAASRS
jgi:hypothetical protein